MGKEFPLVPVDVFGPGGVGRVQLTLTIADAALLRRAVGEFRERCVVSDAEGEQLESVVFRLGRLAARAQRRLDAVVVEAE